MMRAMHLALKAATAILAFSVVFGVADYARAENPPAQPPPAQNADKAEPGPAPAQNADKAEPGPAPAQPSTQPPAPAPATPPAAVTILPNHEVQSILGREVLSTNGDNMGRIVDVLVDRSGEVRAAIIDFGGFLGVGSRKIAVEWNALHFPPPAQADAKITLELTRDQVKAAPEYQDGKPVVVLGALGKLEPLPFQ
jgi:PRC-barrel domain